MTICFYCYTPFHVLNAINLKMHYFTEDNADLYLQDCISGGTSNIIERLSESKIFRNIYLINNNYWDLSLLQKKIHITSRKQKYKNLKRNYKEIRKRSILYDEVWSYGSACEMYLIYGVSRNKNISTNLIFYEEGEGSYRLSCQNALDKEDTIFIQKHFDITIPEFPERMYLYSPSLLVCKQNTRMLSMPKIIEQSIKNKITSIWKITEGIIKSKVIIFIRDYNSYTQMYWLFESLLECGIKNPIVKAHPRFQKSFIQNDVNIIKCGTAPWEAILCATDRLDDMLLIGYFSTALITPKCIFNKEPSIIFLDKMNCDASETALEIISGTKSEYCDKKKVMIPENIIQLKDCFAYWLNNQNHS